MIFSHVGRCSCPVCRRGVSSRLTLGLPEILGLVLGQPWLLVDPPHAERLVVRSKDLGVFSFP